MAGLDGTPQPPGDNVSKESRRALPTVASRLVPGAGEGIRTLDPDLGKVVLYH